MFKLKTINQRLADEKRKNEHLSAQLCDAINALTELANIISTQDEALVELASFTGEGEVNG